MKIQILALHPSKILRTPAQNVVDFADENLHKKIEHMRMVMKRGGGVGIAANQCFLPENIFIARIDNEEIVFINAEKIEKNWIKSTISEMEGCLSIPNISHPVIRSSHISLKYQNEKGEFVEKDFVNMDARVIQHEMDHLAGKLFVDYTSALNQNIATRKMQKIKKKHGYR